MILLNLMTLIVRQRGLLDKEIISASEFDKIENEFHVKKLL